MLAVSTTALFRAPGLAAVATRAAAPTAPLAMAFCPFAAARPQMLSTRAATTTTTTTTTQTRTLTLTPTTAWMKRRSSRPQQPKRVALFGAARSASSASSSPTQKTPNTGAARNADAAADEAAATAVSRAQTAAHADLPPLDWNTFFQLRKTRRRIQLTFSVLGGLGGGLGGGLFLGSGVAEPLLGQVPLDPFLTLGLMTFGFAALGWLAGPSVGNMVFYAWKRPYREQMTLKETQFFARIKKNRVDPSASSASNPVPDFYGEKISSVAGYRQWLKDQRAFSKKRTTFV